MPVDDDALFAEIRAARPQAPRTLERDVLARLDRPRRLPILIGAGVAIAAIVCIVLLLQGRDDGERVAMLDAQIIQPAAPADAPLPADAAMPDPADWEHVSALFAKLELDHRAAIAACGGTGAITITVGRQPDGSAIASHVLYGIGGRGPTPLEHCRVKAVSAIKLPAMPAGLISISFAFPLVGAPLPSHAWSDPLRTLQREVRESAIASCLYVPRSKLTFVVDRAPPHNPRVWLPRFQFSTEKAYGAEKIACAMRVFGKQPFPPLPQFIGEIQAHVEVVK